MFKTPKAFFFLLAVIAAAYALFYWTVNNNSSASHVPGDIRQATSKDFHNCVILKKDHAVVVIDGIANVISYENIQDDFAPYAGKMRDREVNIIGVSDGDYKKMVDVLDLMAIYKIPRYKMMRSGLKSKDI